MSLGTGKSHSAGTGLLKSQTQRAGFPQGYGNIRRLMVDTVTTQWFAFFFFFCTSDIFGVNVTAFPPCVFRNDGEHNHTYSLVRKAEEMNAYRKVWQLGANHLETPFGYANTTNKTTTNVTCRLRTSAAVGEYR